MKVGFIGLGHMGAGMAANLLTAGHQVTVYNRTPNKTRALVEKGAHAAAQVADVCRGDAVVTMLADDDAVEGVVGGEKGVIASLGKGAIHISMSTISVALSRRFNVPVVHLIDDDGAPSLIPLHVERSNDKRARHSCPSL